MNLQRKLFTVFGGLALLALSTAGVTLWATTQWRSTEQDLQSHYQRSLLLQRVRAATFRASREVSDALVDGDRDAAEEFAAALEPVDQDFETWAALADRPEEEKQVEQVRRAYQGLVKSAEAVFQLLAEGRKQEALQLAEGRLEERDFRQFERLSEQAVMSDQSYRQIVLARNQSTRQTAQLVLMLAAFGVLSLILLLAAYLASDLFAPLRETEQALDEVAQGNLQRRLSGDRQDELGQIHHAFNRMVEAIAQREQVLESALVFTNEGTSSSPNATFKDAPSRLTLHTLVAQLRSRVNQLNHQVSSDHNNHNGHNHHQDDHSNSRVAVETKQAVIQQLDHLLQTISRLTEFGFPVDLNLAQTDIRSLLYEVLLRFHEEFIRRNISYELQIAPDVHYALVDRLKLREALGELVRNAIAALPAHGGQIGIRALLTRDRSDLLLAIVDDGKGTEQPLIERTFTNLDDSPNQRPTVGLKLTQAIVEQHGGTLTITSKPNQGTYVQIQLPLHN